jgi:adenine-specific DNA-methyltransferase
MDKMKMHTPDLVSEHIEKIAELFPNAVTESTEGGTLHKVIDFDVLRQELTGEIVEGNQERYQFTWPDKKKSVVLSNAPIAKTLRLDREKSVGRDGTSGSIDSDNIYIEGDNLDALKLLQETYLGKVKMIYIDPPYNTGNDFVYNDSFKQDADEYADNSGQTDEDGNQLVQNTESNGRFHTDWLNMMYPRLRLAKDLLTDDGVIFISIDDNELYNLKKCCDEAFGSSNFIGTLSVENNPKGRKNSAFVSVSSEYCLIYAKNKECAHFIENVPKKASDMKLDENGNYVHGSGKRVLVGENSFNNPVTSKGSEKNYSVYYRRSDNKFELKKEEFGEIDQSLIDEGYVKYYSFNKGKLVENTYTMTKFKELIEVGALEIAQDKIYEKNFSDTIRIKSQLVNREYEAIVRGQKQMYSMELTTTGAGTYLKNLFGTSDVIFTAPKNVGYLKVLTSLFENEPFIVMDFFSGSGTTADAVMRLNAEDNGKRQFIMVQLPEEVDASSAAGKAGYSNLCEIGEERIRRAGKKIKEDSPLTTQDLDVGFRVFKVDSTNMKEVYYKPSEYGQMNLDSLMDNIKEDRTPEDLLIQVMLDLGVLLSSKIEETTIAGKKVFSVADGYLIACFDKDVTEDAVTEIAQKHPFYAVFRDSGMASDSVAANFEQIFETYSPNTVRKVL